MKLAAIEAMWETEAAPAGLTAFGFPNLKAHHTDAGVTIPWALGLMATRSLDGQVQGIVPLVAEAQTRIESGVLAYDALERIKVDPEDPVARGDFELHRRDLGYGLMLKQVVADPRQATLAQIAATAWNTVPNVPVMFWTFRFMAAIGFAMIALFATAFTLCTLRKHETRWFLLAAVAAMPLPWIAAELGWIVAEVGRQPWAVDGVLPTFLGASSLSVPQLWATIISFTVLYGGLAIVEIGLILKTIKRGPFAEQEEFADRPAPGTPDPRQPAAPPVAAPAVA